MSESVSLEVELKTPMSRVWRALTEEATLNQWTLFQVTNFDPAVGHTFRLRSPAGPGWDGIIACEVLEVEPPHRLSYTWVGGARRHGRPYDGGVVTPRNLTGCHPTETRAARL